ncbi:metallophosphoesterase family protein [Dyadobacter aurulentus]|uniref:metallophosphoesterase family protein n=1 Tax=Dyadobacter sp. UC 10 TaxID=2605428 RepID=UPI0011F31DA1|nr:metallophosphoesterase [Dyadobacter sp. UC 10]KAA0992719.1 metallophosphoesterase [Dyadobacter sp. UC 10]
MRVQHRLNIGLKIFLFAMLISALGACRQFEFSPNQASDKHSVTNSNAKNLLKLNEQPLDDTVSIVFVGDSQRWYSELDRFVDKVNATAGVDFILLAGDISDFGLLQEFEWVNRRLSNLNKPYFGVVGNHDLVANGEQVFTNIFGPTDYSFVYDSIKFIAHNTNSLEYSKRKIPDMDWLASEMKDCNAIKHIITVSHVPPFSALEFDQDLLVPYTNLLKHHPKTLLSLHGHVHQHLDFFPFEDGVRYMTSYAFNQNAFVLLKIVDGRVFKTIVDY